MSREDSTALARRDRIVTQLETARAALNRAVTIPAYKKVVDVAAALEVYARRQRLGEETIGLAHRLKIDALALFGALLEGTEKATGGEQYHTRPSTGSKKEPVPTYAQLGLDKKTAMIAQHLAELPEAVRDAIAKRETTLTEARRRARHAARPAVRLPEGTYRVLYADPPWRYSDTRAGLGGESQAINRAETASEQDYPTMTVDELCDLKVRRLAAKDAVLFCWATFPLLPDALHVVAAWGFTYKTAFVWHKPRGSFGHYHKADAELLLVATRGSGTPDSDRRPSQVFRADAEGHSRKPEAARALIDELYIHGPRIELFVRGGIPAAWMAWGNEPGARA